MKSLLRNSLLIILLATPALAFQAEDKLQNPAQEAQAEKLFYEIRCMVCTGESLADSNADLAIDMRRLIRKQLSEGKSPDEIKTYLADHYGEQILQKPPLDAQTYLLWLFPGLMIILGIIIISRVVNGRARVNKKTN